jgi:hypothetical protein
MSKNITFIERVAAVCLYFASRLNGHLVLSIDFVGLISYPTDPVQLGQICLRCVSFFLFVNLFPLLIFQCFLCQVGGWHGNRCCRRSVRTKTFPSPHMSIAPGQSSEQFVDDSVRSEWANKKSSRSFGAREFGVVERFRTFRISERRTKIRLCCVRKFVHSVFASALLEFCMLLSGFLQAFCTSCLQVFCRCFADASYRFSYFSGV